MLRLNTILSSIACHCRLSLLPLVLSRSTPGTMNLSLSLNLRWRREIDMQQGDVFLTYNFMLKSCSHHIDKKTEVIRAEPQDHFANYLYENENVAGYILSFFSRGENDLHDASKEHLLSVGLKLGEAWPRCGMSVVYP